MIRKYQKKNRVIAVFLAVILCLIFTVPVFAVELTDEQSQTLDAAVDKYKASEKEVTKTKNTIAEIETELDGLQSTIDALDARMEETKEELARLEEQKMIQEAELEERLRVMYMYGDDGYLELLFSAEDFAELLTRIDLVRSVMQSDRDCVNAIQKTQNEIEAGIVDLEKDKANVETLKTQQKTLLTSNQALLQAQELQCQAEKNAADEIAKSMGYYGVDQYVSELAWPIDTSNANAFSISSWFGYRSSASTGGVGTTDHKGIDITPGYGTPILAAASGIVSKAEYNDGYGNIVVIEHGVNRDGETVHTWYAHQDHFIVSVGQSVSQGEVIGYVGNTGPSTGPHLHFEVRINNEATDPMSYFEYYRDRCN